MAASPEDFAHWLSAARAGSIEALGQLLEASRGYLYLVVKNHLNPGLQAKVTPSDLIQDTFLEAHRDFMQFRGDSEASLLAWLRQLLLNNVANISRRFQHTAKRSIDRELLAATSSLEDLNEEVLLAEIPSPSEQAVAREQSEALEQALQQLPGDYRAILLLRYQEGRSFEEIAVLMDRSANAVRKLWARAVGRVRYMMEKTS